MKTYITIAEAAPALGLTERALRQRIFRGEVPYRKLGRRVLLSAEELERFMNALPGTTAEAAAATVAAPVNGRNSRQQQPSTNDEGHHR